MSQEPLVARPAWKNFLGLFLLFWIFLVGSIVLFVLGGEQPEFRLWAAGTSGLTLLIFIILIYKRYVWKYTIAGDRISVRRGIISRNQQSTRIQDLRSIELDQGILQRLLNIGDIKFYTAGTDRAEIVFHGIASPASIRETVEQRTLEQGDNERSSPGTDSEPGPKTTRSIPGEPSDPERYCPECGEPASPGDNYCSSCGSRLRE